MWLRPGLALRLILLTSAALLLAVLTMYGVFQLHRHADTGQDLRLPLPDQMAAIAELLDRTPAEQRPLVLRALSSVDLRVNLQDHWPPKAEQGFALPRIAWMTARYLNALGERPVRAELERGADDDFRGPLRIAIGLRDGQIAVVELRGPLMRAALGRPLVRLMMLALLMIGVLSLLALKRQIQPLERLVEAVERFGTAREIPPPPPKGAPEVRRLLDAFTRMRERMHGLLEGRAQLFAAISHDLGTYLTRLRLRVDDLPDERQRDAAERDILQMRQLLSDTLALARPRSTGDTQAGPQEIVDLSMLVRREIAAHAGPAQAIQLCELDEPARVCAREASLARLLNNLVDNALKYAGSAQISVLSRRGLIELRVEDRGPGIAADEIERVTEPFYRGDRSRNLDAGGSGLGLAIVSDIARRLGGELELRPREGGGLSARVRLPAV